VTSVGGNYEWVWNTKLVSYNSQYVTLKYINKKVKIQGKISSSFDTVVGLRQGDALSTFNKSVCGEGYKNCENKPRRQESTQGGTSYIPTMSYFWNIVCNVL
jgi:hypothetical protein